MQYIKLEISVSDEFHDQLITDLLNLDVTGFEQQENRLITYLSEKNYHRYARKRIEKTLDNIPGEADILSSEITPEKNWNRQWEKTIQPQLIGHFFIRPSWSNKEVPNDKLEIKIDPKMAFGTGYHATTRLMLQMLPGLVENHSRVMDVGTGTGILAIAAAKLGAQQVLAFDIDKWSFQNAKENSKLNNVSSRVAIKKGSTEVVPEESSFDLVLANINRNVIIELLNTLAKHVRAGGYLLLSGLLASDKQKILDRKELDNLKLIKVRKMNNWIAILFKNASK